MDSPITVKGSYLVYTLKYLSQTYPEGVVEEILARLSAKAKADLRVTMVGSQCPITTLFEMLDAILAVLGKKDPNINYVIGKETFKMTFSAIYKLFLRFGNPHYVLEKTATLWSSFNSGGKLACAERMPKRAILRLTGFPLKHEQYCAQRLRGGFEAILELCGCQIAMSSHTKCICKGADCCEWTLTWK